MSGIWFVSSRFLLVRLTRSVLMKPFDKILNTTMCTLVVFFLFLFAFFLYFFIGRVLGQEEKVQVDSFRFVDLFLSILFNLFVCSSYSIVLATDVVS